MLWLRDEHRMATKVSKLNKIYLESRELVLKSTYRQKAAAVDTDKGLPRGRKQNQLTGKGKRIFTSTVYNLIYKYIFRDKLEKYNNKTTSVVQSPTSTLILKCQSDY